MSTYFPPGGIADRMISFNGFPFLDTKEEHTFHVSVSSVMTPVSQTTLIPSVGLTLRALETLLRKTTFQGFPVVENRSSKVLLGYVGRTELRYAIDKAKKEQSLSQDAKCIFFAPASTAARTPSALTPPVTFEQLATSSSVPTIDFSRFVDPTPLAVHPRMALETVMEVFKKIGPRVVLVELKGRLAGLVTVKDCLKYQFKVEAQERDGDGDGDGDGRVDRFEVYLRDRLKRAAEWARDCVGRVSNGRIELGHGEARGERLLRPTRADASGERDSFGPRDGEPDGGILDGTEDDDEGVELRDRS